MTVPYAFSAATSAIPLSQLDDNFNTTITLGNTAIQLGNTVTTLNNMTLANVTINSGNVTITNVTVSTANVTTGNITNLISSNVALTGGAISNTTLGAATASTANVTTLTTSSTVTLNGGTANGVAYLNGSKVLTTGSALTFDGTNLSNAGRYIVTANSAGVTDVSYGRYSNGAWINTPSATVGYLAIAGGSAFAWDSSNLISYIGGSEGMRLTSTGLGIGTSSPGTKLEVTGDITQTWAASMDRFVGSKFSTTYELGLHFLESSRETRIVSKAADSTDKISFYTGVTPTEKMRLDTSGNLGIGTSSPGAKLNVQQTATGNFTSLLLSRTTGNTLDEQSIVWQQNDLSNLQIASIAGAVETGTTGSLRFKTNGGSGLTERARITSGGDLLVGTQSTAFTGRVVALQATSASDVFTAWNSATTGDNSLIGFFTDGGTGRGSITYNRAGGLVAYNTTSDYRAKDIIGPVANPGATIDALKVYSGKMKGATQPRPMLVAHEAQAVAPYSVTGEKDAVNESGDPIFQQMDVSSLVPLLIAEIQSLRQRVAQLEGA